MVRAPEPDEANEQSVDRVDPARQPPKKGLTLGELLRAAALDKGGLSGMRLTGKETVAALGLGDRPFSSALSGLDFSRLALAPKLNLSEALVGSWRTQLLAGRSGITNAVASDMSRSIAAVRMAGYNGLAGIDLRCPGQGGER